MDKRFLFLGAFFGGLAVALGAFGAHGLKSLAPDVLGAFQTGVQYQMYHSLALLTISLASARLPNQWLKVAGYLFCLGVILFSGSLYLITALHVYGKEVPVLVGLLTPTGGICFIGGWLCFFIGAFAKS